MWTIPKINPLWLLDKWNDPNHSKEGLTFGKTIQNAVQLAYVAGLRLYLPVFPFTSTLFGPFNYPFMCPSLAITLRWYTVQTAVSSIISNCLNAQRPSAQFNQKDLLIRPHWNRTITFTSVVRQWPLTVPTTSPLGTRCHLCYLLRQHVMGRQIFLNIEFDMNPANTLIALALKPSENTHIETLPFSCQHNSG